MENKNKATALSARPWALMLASWSLAGLSGHADADQYEDAAKKWVESEFQPSTLSEDSSSRR